MTQNSDNFNAVIPLESNPAIFTQFAHRLGLSPILEFVDIYSILDPDLLAFLSRPIQAIILLFPVSAEYEAFKNEEETHRAGPILDITKPNDKLSSEDSTQLYHTESNTVWLKQVLKNACGLYALLHILLNLPAGLIVQDSLAAKLRSELTNTANADPVKLIKEITASIYDNYSQQGQTEAPQATDDVDLHFVCFLRTDAGIVELDGRRSGAVLLDSNNDTGDVIDSVSVTKRIEKYMSLAEGENSLKFAMMGLAPNLN